MNIENKTSTAPEASPPPSSPVPRGPRLWVILVAAVLVLAALAAGAIWSGPLKAMVDRVTGRSAETETPAAVTQYYTCGMHPWVHLPHPGLCPICHMELVPETAGRASGEIVIDPIVEQNIGVRVTPVITGPLRQVVRTVGSVDYNETLVRDVNLKVSGWVDKLYVNETGQAVDKDQPLLEIYSPDLYSAQEEYLLAFRQKEAAKRSGSGDAQTANADLLESALKKLEYLDVPAEQIRALEQAGKPSKTLVVKSPFRGTVVTKNVFEGQRVEAGMQLLRLADLSKVWVLVTIYEYQVPYIEVGQKAVMSLPYLSGQTIPGKVAYVYPYLNPELRQAKVRLEFDNPGGLLKPGMFANVELERTLTGDRVLVPREAVIETGTRQVTYVSLGQGRFMPRDVQVGAEAEGGLVEITSGLKPGEVVVTSGEFLFDSDSRLRENAVKTSPVSSPGEEAAPASPEHSNMPPMPGM